MVRHAAKPPQPEDVDPIDAVPDPDAVHSEPAHIDLAKGLPSAAEDIDHVAADWPAPKPAPSPKARGGVLTLIVIALAGMAIGFAAVALL